MVKLCSVAIVRPCQFPFTGYASVKKFSFSLRFRFIWHGDQSRIYADTIYMGYCHFPPFEKLTRAGGSPPSVSDAGSRPCGQYCSGSALNRMGADCPPAPPLSFEV